MSQQLINLNPDLKRLRDEGYAVGIVDNKYLVIRGIPYVNSSQIIKFGTLVSELNLAGDQTVSQINHVVLFFGEYPCDKNGVEINQIRHQSEDKNLAEGLLVNHSFSSKPANGYKDFYEKMTTYIAIISHQAQSLDPAVTAQTYPVIEPDEEETVFNYFDTASSRAGINIESNKLKVGKIGIVGLGGTGSYILDLIAKTPVGEIHLFDGDKFLNHNAFRSPGAPSIDELRNKLQKVDYFKERYSKMHRHIIAHDGFIDETNTSQLEGLDFVFLSMDGGTTKKQIIEKLEEYNIPFIDSGLGVEQGPESLGGILAVTTSTNKSRDHIKKRISFNDLSGDNDYSTNIQVADLNALNAALAVIKWKKIFGFYRDLEKETYCAYTIDSNSIINEDHET